MAVTIELALLSRVSYGGLEITGSRLQGLLALLAEDPHAGSSTTRLIDALWPDEPPEHPFKALQVVVSRARARLGPDVIVSTPAGYRLSLRGDQIDASAVLLYAAESEKGSRAGDYLAALEHAEAGLAADQHGFSSGFIFEHQPIRELALLRRIADGIKTVLTLNRRIWLQPSGWTLQG